MQEQNQAVEQVIENDTIMKIRFGGYLQFLLTLFIAWLFYNTFFSYSLIVQKTPLDRDELVRIHKATGLTEVYDNQANGWVRIQRSSLVYVVNEEAAKDE